MMNEDRIRMEHELDELIKERFTAAPLFCHAQLFVNEKRKEPVHFGQLTILHYRMFGGVSDIVYKAAAAVELFILASDILDDIQDQDAPSKAWMQVPLPMALNTATALITLSQQALMECGENAEIRLRLAAMMNNQLITAANGQMLDLANAIQEEQDYFEMIRQKSAAILVLACMAGVMLAGQGWHDTVAEYAGEIGMAAQIRNDLRDLLRWDEKSDFINRKKTLLTLFLQESAAENDQWIADYLEGRLQEDDIRDKHHLLKEACERTGTILYGSVMSRMHYNRFEELLDSVPESPPFRDYFMQLLA
ncbi:polyprenyl synthetase family protein [Paenibacillus protaetiae]|uniref:Polyprenyl synthetase n=1 Tax=Paenibacillus protaetiae TaxID=2509456 RepID=A0A4P6EXC8_9BACL|nr:polyprenyl synthetase family protein [Paenibacillus protaetiae]QAY66883.1 hypothetical protein ET464_11240 [Paenibacillus protaetiae]